MLKTKRVSLALALELSANSPVFTKIGITIWIKKFFNATYVRFGLYYRLFKKWKRVSLGSRLPPEFSIRPSWRNDRSGGKGEKKKRERGGRGRGLNDPNTTKLFLIMCIFPKLPKIFAKKSGFQRENSEVGRLVLAVSCQCCPLCFRQCNFHTTLLISVLFG